MWLHTYFEREKLIMGTAIAFNMVYFPDELKQSAVKWFEHNLLVLEGCQFDVFFFSFTKLIHFLLCNSIFGKLNYIITLHV